MSYDKKKPEPGKESTSASGQAMVPRDCNPVDAVDPYTGKPWKLYVRNRKVEQTALKGMGAARELAFTVLNAVQKPTAVFKGVRDSDDGDEDWLIYVSNPAFAYDHQTGNQVRAWKGEVFLVFVDEDRIIRRWFWDEADHMNPKLPVNHDKERFVEKLL